MSGERKRRWIAREMARNPYCHWCGRKLTWYWPHPNGHLPPDFATRDHLNSRNQSDPRPAVGKWVLACRKCNQDRAADEVRALPLDELHRRARMNPCACGCGELARSDFAYKRGHGDDNARV